jgi:hypothetical protein
VLVDLAAQAGVSLQQRPQELAPQAWVALAAGLNRLKDPPAAVADSGRPAATP